MKYHSTNKMQQQKTQLIESIKKNITKMIDIACTIKRSTTYGYSIVVQDIKLSTKM